MTIVTAMADPVGLGMIVRDTGVHHVTIIQVDLPIIVAIVALMISEPDVIPGNLLVIAILVGDNSSSKYSKFHLTNRILFQTPQRTSFKSHAFNQCCCLIMIIKCVFKLFPPYLCEDLVVWA